MPQIAKEKLDAMIAEVPDNLRDAFLSDFKSRGFSIAPPQQTYMGMAKQAVGETLREDLPVVAGAKQRLQGASGDISEALGRTGLPAPISAAAGAIVGSPLEAVGEALPKTGADLALQGLAGPAIKAGGAMGQAFLKAGRKVIPTISGALSRIEAPIVERAIERGKQVASKFSQVGEGDAAEQVVVKIKDAVVEARRAIGQRLGAVEDAVVAKNTGKIVKTADIGARLDSDLAKAGFKTPTNRGGEVSQKISSKTAEILNDFKNMSGQKPGNMSFKDALNLRRKIDTAVEFIGKGSLEVGSAEEAFLKSARKELNLRLLDVDPMFRKANAAAANVYQAYEALSKDVLSGKPETVARRITGLFKKGSMERRLIERLDAIGGKAAGQLDEFLDLVTAQKFKPALNPSVVRAAQHTGGGLMAPAAAVLGHAAIGGPKTVAVAAGGMAATSPRLNFHVLQAAKEISQILQRLGINKNSQIAASLLAPKLHEELQRGTKNHNETSK